MDNCNSLTELGLVDRGNGTLTDIRTNLVWQLETSKMNFTWQEAKQYCNEVRLGGHSDWRLPSIEELSTLINKDNDPTIDRVFNCNMSWYWSSTIDSDTEVWAVNFSTAIIQKIDKTRKYYVRAVRKNI